MRLLIVVLSLLVTMSAMAQRNKKRQPSRKANVEKRQPSASELMFENMLPSTRKVMFIDSMVVRKSEFLSHIPLPSECGTLADDKQGASFQNDFINKKYFSKRDTSGVSRIYTSDRLAGQWSTPQELSALGKADYPFLMADGTTLYFAGKGEASLGGYDIFVTRYDGDDGTFLEPQNMGLPFNSLANDYLYVEDEIDSLAWLVTDRNQPDSIVCIYTLVPDGHQSYDVSEMTNEQLRGLAKISEIKNTWYDQHQKNNALKRLYALRKGGAKTKGVDEINFVVNDKISYTSASQFKSPSNRDNFKKLQSLKKEKEDNIKSLTELRERYSASGKTAQRNISNEILSLEKEILKQEESIAKMEISIRNTENMLTK
jgi:hypothetical protein